MGTGPAPREPLRQRLPGYLTAFGLGLAAAGLIGLIVGLATSAGLGDALGYTYSALGALLLLVGGMRGSGYGNPVARAGEGRSGGSGADRSDDAERQGGQDPPKLWGGFRMGADLVERRRRRLLAPPDPAAFWQVMAGVAYFGLGVLLMLLCAAD